MARARRCLAVVVTLVLSVAALALPGRPLPASAATPIAFSTPSIVDPVHTYGEPDILLDPTGHGRVYASGPTGTGTQRSVWNASVDGGRTYRIVTQGTPPDPQDRSSERMTPDMTSRTRRSCDPPHKRDRYDGR